MSERLVDSIVLAHLPSGDHQLFHKSQLSILDNIVLAGLDITPELQKYKDCYKLLDNSQVNIGKSEYTKEIQEKDIGRENVFFELVDLNTLKGKSFMATDEEKQASYRVSIILDKGKEIKDLGLDRETALLINVIQILRTECKADIELLGLGKIIDEVERLNNSVEELMRKRNEQKGGAGESKLKTARLEIDAAYKVTTARLDATVIFSRGTNDACKECIKLLNGNISHFNNVIATRTAGKFGKKTKSWSPLYYGEVTPLQNADENEDTPVEKYPNAKEWTNDYNPSDWKNGDIGYVYIDGKKVYYELIDERSIDIPPTHVEWEAAWKLIGE